MVSVWLKLSWLMLFLLFVMMMMSCGDELLCKKCEFLVSVLKSVVLFFVVMLVRECLSLLVEEFSGWCILMWLENVSMLIWLLVVSRFLVSVLLLECMVVSVLFIEVDVLSMSVMFNFVLCKDWIEMFIVVIE